MQAVKNGIKCTLRTPGKAALFALILAVLSALMSVSFMGYSAVSGYIRDANAYYHTIAELEFVGEDYPDQNVTDPALGAAMEKNKDALDALTENPAVLAYEPNEAFLTIIDGLKRRDDYVFNSKSAVLAIYIMAENSEGRAYTGVISRCYYSLKNTEDKLTVLRVDDETTENGGLEVGKTYVMSGYYFKGDHGGDNFQQQKVVFEDEEGEAETLGPTLYEDRDLPDSNVFMRLARVLNIQNNGCRVTYTDSLSDLVPFHQQVMKISSGRLFTREEYETCAHVCVISDKIAGILEKKVGDTVKATVFGSDENIYRVASLYEVDEGEYEIVGIFNEVDDYPFWVFMPGLRTEKLKASSGYTVATFLLKNEGAAGFIRAAEKLDGTGFKVTVYDQGYSAAVDPLRELMLISVIFLGVCLLLAAAALMLQSWVFVSRQRESALTMYKLGSGRAHIIIYFLSAALIITAIAAVIGCFAGKLVESRVLGVMKSFASQFAKQDTRFSFMNRASVRQLVFDPVISARVYVTAGGALTLGSALFTLVFSLRALSEQQTKKKKTRKRKLKNTAHAHTSKLGGPLKYCFISIRRSWARTLAVLLLTSVAAVFFVRLSASLEGYREQLEAYRSSAVITGSVTDIYGRRIDRLNVKSDPIKALIDAELIDDCSISKFYGHCTLLGVGITADGVVRDMDELGVTMPETRFETESLFLSISRDRPWVGVSSIENNPQTHYAKPEVTWLEGFSQRDFFSNGLFCALSESTMKEYGINLGDAVLFETIGTDFGDPRIGFILMKVIASYVSASTTKTVFSALRPQNPTWGDPYENYPYWQGVYEEWIANGNRNLSMQEFIYLKLNAFPDKEIETQGNGYTMYSPVINLSSCLFGINDPSKLDELREALLEAGYTFVGSGERLKNFAVIYDEIYLNTVRSMERQIQYVTALYYSLYVIVFIIGAALAWLLCSSRRQEIALMRALGTQKRRIILNFFMEQVILSAAGLGVGLGISYAIGGVNTFALTLSAVFFGLWCLAALICLIVSLLKRARAALTEPE